ncbi:carboxypeptidase-like regulatory domain-containing protein [Maribacter sp. Asnod1-A12]|uniref:carboxypeptidase-like regulatory domain-containing protein n=1 Tax=Maribacter sp. Asnod1-A12 TaxID=3160576 RepID=UPI00386CD666
MKKIYFLFALITCSLAYAQETSSIRGKILDGEFYNEPLLMASVSIDNAEFSTQTNFRGNFEFDDILPGKHEVLVQFVGYEPMYIEITVNEGESAEILETLYAKRLSMPTTTKVSVTTEDALNSLELASNKTK